MIFDFVLFLFMANCSTTTHW